MSEIARTQVRLQVINSYVMSGGQNYMSFVSPKKGADLLDMCILENS
jgi:hypothetical protein